MSTVQENYKEVCARVDAACIKAGRERQQVRLLAVSKTKPADMVRDCYQLGQTAFGENYLQDALEKIDALRDLPDIEWHFIGPLQSNKTKAVAENFHWLETLDREKIARRLNDQRPPALPPLNVLIQINISDEDQKSGISSTEVQAFAQTLASLPRLKVRGLMCIPEATDDEQRLQQQFERMQQLSRDLTARYPEANVLSMGMSSDLELAIACGSTEVRIGTDIFGARNTPAAQ
ncbi:YggS family pyridoxal phosphate-dependent enzyme [Thalassolituus maritimus]|uniref:Pyridoxal phosphate homeostasis protein n=1 Tax=Thalassolituus maritimus TaxID=484498 RepID=A0ABP9ZX51_9GAMM